MLEPFFCGVQVAEKETEAMQPLKICFPPTEYVKVIKISSKCYIVRRKVY